MSLMQIISKFRNGTIHTFDYTKEIVLPKKFAGHTLVKNSTLQGRIGIDYTKVAEPKGKPSKFAKEGKFLVNDNGELYLRVFPLSSRARKRQFILDGENKTLEELLAFGIAPSLIKPNEEKPVCVTLKLANIKGAR